MKNSSCISTANLLLTSYKNLHYVMRVYLVKIGGFSMKWSKKPTFFHIVVYFSHIWSHRLKVSGIHHKCTKNQTCVATICPTILVLIHMGSLATLKISHILSHCSQEPREPPNNTRNFVPSQNQISVNSLWPNFFD